MVAPVIRELVEAEGVGEEEGGVGFAEVEFDAPTLTTSASEGEGLGVRFMVCEFFCCGRLLCVGCADWRGLEWGIRADGENWGGRSTRYRRCWRLVGGRRSWGPG